MKLNKALNVNLPNYNINKPCLLLLFNILLLINDILIIEYFIALIIFISLVQ